MNLSGKNMNLSGQNMKFPKFNSADSSGYGPN